MTDQKKSDEPELKGFEEKLKDQARRLKELVDSGDISGALSVVSDLDDTRDQTLFVEVGRLTRTLHESIRNFRIDSIHVSADKSTINDASDRLAYVVEMTNKAATKTLDLVEDTMPYAAEIKNEAKSLEQKWKKLQRKEMKPDEFRALSTSMATFLGKLSRDSDKVHENLSEILIAQDFQDLTGQVLNRVMSLVTEVEENLVDLVRMAGKVDIITGTTHEVADENDQSEEIKGEGPQMNAEVRNDVVSGQDDVDDLLSSLGF